MNFNLTVHVAQLKIALAIISKLRVSSNIMATSLVRLEIGDREASLSYCDGDIQITTPLPFAAPSGGQQLIVSRKALAEICKTTDRGTTVHFGSKSAVQPNGEVASHLAASCTSKGFATSHHVHTYLDNEIFPDLEPRGRRIPLRRQDLANFRLAATASSRDETRYVLNGAALDPAEGGNIIATDGRRMFTAACRAPGHILIIPNTVLAILGHKALHTGALLTSAAPSDDEVRPVHSLRFPGSATIAFKGIEGNFPRWQQVIPNPASYQGTVAFTPATAERILTWLRTKRGCTLRIETRHNAVQLTRYPEGKGTDTEESITALAGILNSPPDKIAFNADFFADGLAAGFQLIHLIDAISPGVFAAPESRYVLMPMRLIDPVIPDDADEEVTADQESEATEPVSA